MAGLRTCNQPTPTLTFCRHPFWRSADVNSCVLPTAAATVSVWLARPPRFPGCSRCGRQLHRQAVRESEGERRHRRLAAHRDPAPAGEPRLRADHSEGHPRRRVPRHRGAGRGTYQLMTLTAQLVGCPDLQAALPEASYCQPRKSATGSAGIVSSHWARSACTNGRLAPVVRALAAPSRSLAPLILLSKNTQ
jgi:hypothetical protein